MLKIATVLIIVIFTFLQADDDQYVWGSRSRRSFAHSHFDAASSDLAEKKRIKFRLGSGISSRVAKLDRKTFGNQAATLLLIMPSAKINAKRFKNKKDKVIEIETIAFTDEARKPPFLEEATYYPLNNDVSKQ